MQRRERRCQGRRTDPQGECNDAPQSTDRSEQLFVHCHGISALTHLELLFSTRAAALDLEKLRLASLPRITHLTLSKADEQEGTEPTPAQQQAVLDSLSGSLA